MNEMILFFCDGDECDCDEIYQFEVFVMVTTVTAMSKPPWQYITDGSQTNGLFEIIVTCDGFYTWPVTGAGHH
uniref:Uncharacterized protein n=1 Tax=Oryza nivara TaxID=4536 RepID=A0A0E0GY90_ORYNI